MDRCSTIKVLPVYGYGWVISGEPRFEIPAPFTVELEVSERTRWTGVVRDDEHEFRGQRVELSQRHVGWTGDINIVIEPLDPTRKPSSGFARFSRFADIQ